METKLNCHSTSESLVPLLNMSHGFLNCAEINLIILALKVINPLHPEALKQNRLIFFSPLFFCMQKVKSWRVFIVLVWKSEKVLVFFLLRFFKRPPACCSCCSVSSHCCTQQCSGCHFWRLPLVDKVGDVSLLLSRQLVSCWHYNISDVGHRKK